MLPHLITTILRIRGICQYGELTANDINGLEFSSTEEAEYLYVKCAKHHGFAIRKDEAEIVMKQFVCSREGHKHNKHFQRTNRKKDPKPLSHVGCEHRLRILYDSTKSIWKVKKFVRCHNYELTLSRYVHLFPTHHGMTDADKAQVDSLQPYGIRTCHKMDYTVAQKGGHCFVGFTKKDLYNYFDDKMWAITKMVMLLVVTA